MFDVKSITSPKECDCGATCLQMMLDYYGTQTDLATLIEDCNTNIWGCNAKDLINAGSKHGLDLHAYSMPTDELLAIDRPAIVWWKNNHFVIYCGQSEDGKVVIANPDKGRYGIRKGVFDAYYCEVAITNGEPDDLTEPITIYDKYKALQERNEMLEDCIIEMANIIYA